MSDPFAAREYSQGLVFRVVSWLIPVALVLLAFSAYWLARRGATEFLDSTGGRIQEVIVDPFAPGYEAIVESTPSVLTVLVGERGDLASVAIITSDATAADGGVLVFPGVVEIDDVTLNKTFADSGAEAVEVAMGRLINAGFDSVVVLDESSFVDLLGPTGPIELVIPDRLVTRDAVGTASLTFESGDGSIASEYASLYVGWRNPDENIFVYLSRQFGFWKAMLSNLATDPDALRSAGLAAEGDLAALQSMLGTVLAGDYELREAAYDVAGDPTGDATATLDNDRLADVMAELLPFPKPAAPGERPRVRLLDGVGDRDELLDYSTSLVRAGAQVTVIGNAAEFDVDITRIVVHDGDARDEAEQFAQVLGAGRIETDIPDAAAEDLPETIFDVTVVIGSDAAS